MFISFQNLIKLFPFFFLLLCLPKAVMAQEDPIIKDLIEQLAPELEEDYDLSELLENLNTFRKNPIDLNRTDVAQLKTLFFLSPLQISNFFSYLKDNGRINNLLELQTIDGFDLLTLERLLPFVKIDNGNPLDKLLRKDLYKAAEQEVFFRYGQTLEKPRGFEDLPGSHYLGTREKLLGKYKYRYKDLISANLILEKDAGERLFAENIKSRMDFLSGNISISNVGRIKNLVIGDYSLQFGQGLSLWSGFGFGKGPDVTSVAKKDLGLRPYSSANEISFLRGAAVSINLPHHLVLTAFGSSRRLDASTKTDSSGVISQVNIGSSGLHRTPTEIKNKSALGQRVFGAALQYLSDNLNIGITAYKSQYSNAFVTGPLPYNRFNFVGNDLTNVGLHYNYTFYNIYFYGETAHSVDGGIATVNGAMASLSRMLSLVLVNRHYDKDHHSFFTRSLGESTDASNESGWYAGINITPSKKITYALYGDYFKFPWLKYRIDLPSKGYEVLTQMVYTPDKKFKATVRFKTERKQQNPDGDIDSVYIVGVNKRNYRLAISYNLNRTVSLESRAEFTQYDKSIIHDNGFLIFQDISLKPMGSKLSGNARLAYFYTDSYNSRLYAYEDDVLYSSGFGMYNGKGFRTYLNLRYKLRRNLDVWTKYAVFLYQDVNTVGSGLDQIQGNKKNDVKFQLRYQF
jgi:hypothetical protein